MVGSLHGPRFPAEGSELTSRAPTLADVDEEELLLAAGTQQRWAAAVADCCSSRKWFPWARIRRFLMRDVSERGALGMWGAM